MCITVLFLFNMNMVMVIVMVNVTHTGSLKDFPKQIRWGIVEEFNFSRQCHSCSPTNSVETQKELSM